MTKNKTKRITLLLVSALSTAHLEATLPRMPHAISSLIPSSGQNYTTAECVQLGSALAQGGLRLAARAGGQLSKQDSAIDVAHALADLAGLTNAATAVFINRDERVMPYYKAISATLDFADLVKRIDKLFAGSYLAGTLADMAPTLMGEDDELDGFDSSGQGTKPGPLAMLQSKGVGAVLGIVHAYLLPVCESVASCSAAHQTTQWEAKKAHIAQGLELLSKLLGQCIEHRAYPTWVLGWSACCLLNVISLGYDGLVWDLSVNGKTSDLAKKAIDSDNPQILRWLFENRKRDAFDVKTGDAGQQQNTNALAYAVNEHSYNTIAYLLTHVPVEYEPEDIGDELTNQAFENFDPQLLELLLANGIHIEYFPYDAQTFKDDKIKQAKEALNHYERLKNIVGQEPKVEEQLKKLRKTYAIDSNAKTWAEQRTELEQRIGKMVNLLEKYGIPSKHEHDEAVRKLGLLAMKALNQPSAVHAFEARCCKLLREKKITPLTKIVLERGKEGTTLLECVGILHFLKNQPLNSLVSLLVNDYPCQLRAFLNKYFDEEDEKKTIESMVMFGAYDWTYLALTHRLLDVTPERLQLILTHGIKSGNPDFVKLALEHGAQVNLYNEKTTCLDLAQAIDDSDEDKPFIIKLLKGLGALTGSEMQEKFAPIYKAFTQGSQTKEADENNAVDELIKLWEQGIVDDKLGITHLPQTNTALEKLVQAQIRLGIGNLGNALYHAVKTGNVGAAKLLLEHDTVNPNEFHFEWVGQGYDQHTYYTPLHIAAQQGNRDMVTLLLEHGASKFAQHRGSGWGNSDGPTVAQVADTNVKDLIAIKAGEEPGYDSDEDDDL
ncbi:MAG: ankyrin repeat domain-containing protein [Epsilonproteobacteria bacterium]|nr:ankyrin repeat domain-containing protein [Campylobacterota bacterium]